MNFLSHISILISIFVLSFAAQAQSALHPKFERALPGEAELKQEIIRGILHLQEKQAKDSGGPKLRGTHAKGVCAKAEFEIFNNSNELKVGVFAFPGVYPATVRFANARGEIHPDQTDDVRSLSFSVEMPASISNAQGRMDFSTNDATTFPINDADVFAALMTLARRGPVLGAWDVGVNRALRVGDALIIGAKMQRPLSVSYQKNQYWSGVPFLFGDSHAIKYKLNPCATNQAGPLTGDPNTLGKELARHLDNDPEMSCFEFQVQVLDENKLTDWSGGIHSVQDWIENATWEWSESQIPFQTLAKLTLKKNSLLSAKDCEAIRINVNKNTTPDHRGLGSINRGRTGAEESSYKNR